MEETYETLVAWTKRRLVIECLMRGRRIAELERQLEESRRWVRLSASR